MYYISNTLLRPKEAEMDFIRNIAGRDWAIGIGAFLMGAWIF